MRERGSPLSHDLFVTGLGLAATGGNDGELRYYAIIYALVAPLSMSGNTLQSINNRNCLLRMRTLLVVRIKNG